MKIKRLTGITTGSTHHTAGWLANAQLSSRSSIASTKLSVISRLSATS